jgi:hypothetical protein
MEVKVGDRVAVGVSHGFTWDITGAEPVAVDYATGPNRECIVLAIGCHLPVRPTAEFGREPNDVVLCTLDRPYVVFYTRSRYCEPLEVRPVKVWGTERDGTLTLDLPAGTRNVRLRTYRADSSMSRELTLVLVGVAP